jgi:hypothetical protein
MKPIKIENDKFYFQMDAYGMFKLDAKDVVCPEESGFSGVIHNQEDRVALARFLGEVSTSLATQKRSKPIIHNSKFDIDLVFKR